jgi:hypothetical protein
MRFKPQEAPTADPAPPPVTIKEQIIKPINQTDATLSEQQEQSINQPQSNSNNSKKNFSRNPKKRFTN